MLVNNELISDPSTIADKFNDFFTNIGPRLANKIPVTNIKATQFLKGDHQNSFFFPPVSEPEIIKVISDLKNSHSKGSDNIPVNLVKCCAVELSSILTHLNNESLSTGIFPDVL
jgi:hypothetical protein